MAIILSKDARDFIENLPLKQAKQILLKIQTVENRDLLTNCKILKGEGNKYFRIAVGEYRVIYQWLDEDLYIFLIGKRNDDEIYRMLDRKK